MFEPSRQLVEIASWRMVAEMVRRHPGIRVIESHPGGGMYDCLDLILADDPAALTPRITVNRVGRAHFRLDTEAPAHSWDDFWCEYLAADDSREIIRRMEALAGLAAPRRLPVSTAAVVTYRFIAAFLAHSAFGLERWECRSGRYDTSGPGGPSRSRRLVSHVPRGGRGSGRPPSRRLPR